jgi:hypothetical protein
MVDAGLIISYVLIGLCVAAAVILPLIQALGNPQSLKMIGISVGALLVVFFICYLISDSDTMGNDAITPSTARLVGASLTMFYLLTGIALVSIVYTEVKKMFD